MAQIGPRYPEEQLHLKPRRLLWGEHVAPFRHGSVEHGSAVDNNRNC